MNSDKVNKLRDELTFWRVICLDVFGYNPQKVKSSLGRSSDFELRKKDIIEFLFEKEGIWRQGVILELLYEKWKERSSFFDMSLSSLPLQSLEKELLLREVIKDEVLRQGKLRGYKRYIDDGKLESLKRNAHQVTAECVSRLNERFQAFNDNLAGYCLYIAKPDTQNYILFLSSTNNVEDLAKNYKEAIKIKRRKAKEPRKKEDKWNKLLKRYLEILVSSTQYFHWAGKNYIEQEAIKQDDKDGNLSPRDIFYKSKECEIRPYNVDGKKDYSDKNSNDKILNFLKKSTIKNAVVLGEPGIGKTTALKRYCFEIADNQIKQKSADIIPILLMLGDAGIEKYIFSLIKTSLCSIIDDFSDLAEKQFNEFASRIVVVFDGFNEITDDVLRMNIEKWIQIYSDKGVKFIISSRKYAFPDKIEGFEYFEICRFNTKEISLFLNQNYKIYADEILREIDKKSLREIAGIAFYLDAMGKVFQADGKLPENKALLLERLVKIEYLGEREGIDIDSPLFGLIVEILKKIAFNCNNNFKKDWEQTFRLEDFSSEISKSRNNLSLTEEKELRAKILNTGLILNVGERFFFPHQIFSEYLGPLKSVWVERSRK